ncbi:pilus assembly protein [Thiohalophilus thiocyanatoxydans]|uniref:Type IV pilus assembly protein PilY1 n=1 Tax=Thiohalophilus thiocyanatoxydans TaxID=381308 RepID=A0A4V3H3D1_9GAMM|nr:PilC/PilY family type IV pilus protein [Thiohalophilus thiocyanatoxydans]TDX97923.1 type IV pilus assembly protein PilY1 [Thiohalophilus thiocyanatoxydans]
MNALHRLNTVFNKKTAIFVVAALCAIQLAAAATVNGSATDFNAIPIQNTGNNQSDEPLAMLVMSNDEQLYNKAYDDYSDLNGDGKIETTYNDEIDYYGYFNSNGCYTHDGNRFNPASTATGDNDHTCASSEWSGNFLNWASMTRMDIVRKVLYGGYRSTDDTWSTTDGHTILERVYLPNDIHAFAKVFETSTTSEMQKFTPYAQKRLSMCNLTGTTNTATESQLINTDNNPPLLRVAAGSWHRWASQNKEQCLYSGDTSTPDGADELDELIVQVSVCEDGKLESGCAEYTDGGNTYYKPAGLLQKYSKSAGSKMHFGLISGSYGQKDKGGVLRKNISVIDDDDANNTDGDEITDDGRIKDDVQGIINTINSFRVVKYDSDDNKYIDCASPGITVDEFKTSSDTAKQCTNWGNPIGEMYLEALRYFSGNTSPSAVFDADDSGLINSSNNSSIPTTLNKVTWEDPIIPDGQSGQNYCASCNIILLSSGLNNFDGDDLLSAKDIEGINNESNNLSGITDEVGQHEGYSGNFFIGNNGSTSDGECTAKEYTTLHDMTGICPEQPTLEGSYQIAGLAFHGRTTDLRPDNTSYPDTQNVNTYSIAMARGVPQFRIPAYNDSGVKQGEFNFMPACGANSDGTASLTDSGWRQCSLVDIQLVNPIYKTVTDSDSGETVNVLTNATARITWEDSTWGNDYDMDGVQDLRFSYDPSTQELTVTVESKQAEADHALRWGYAISGSDNDGLTYPLLRPGKDNYDHIGTADVRTCATASDCQATYSPGNTSTQLLEDPLWYAAKWGGFNDLNDNNRPDLTSEWDQKNNRTGERDPDGIPDNYFLATNPNELEKRLDGVFNDLLKRLSAGSAAAVIADTVTMTGGVVQALYQPEQAIDGKILSWTGLVHSVFIDENGNLREDTNGNARLDDYSTDKWIQIQYDESVERTRIFYCNQGDDCASYDDIKEIEDLNPIWNARDRLAEVSSTRITEQRAYDTSFGDSSAGGRHIFTWLDNDTDNVVDSGEVVDFVDDNITTGNYGYLNAVDATEAKNIVNFIRGDDSISGYRNRTADYDGEGEKVWRLGDIVHSTPLIVSNPSEGWDIRYGDNTYREFRAEYSDRRSVVYVGANDGMLHAFNAGFFDGNNSRFCLDAGCTAPSDAHPLGAELWAYVPKNLLPHLRWLTEPDYPHVYYMDGKPQSFDVNIFPDDPDHPGGWGTILVVGMRLGGGKLGVDYDNDGGDPDYTAQSAYAIFDITNPENPPELLAEFTDADLGFTTSAPQIAVRRQADETSLDWSDPVINDWYLVFGNGPTDLDSVTSANNAQLYALKLELLANDSLNVDASQVTKIDTGITSSFVGDPAVVDWSNDFLSDAIYFGTVGGTPAVPDGQLMRIALTSDSTADWASSSNRGTLIDPGQPFVHRPELHSLDGSPQNEWWVYASTGRLYTSADNGSVETQSMYGIREIHDPNNLPVLPDVDVSVSRDSTATYPLQEVTGVSVYTDGTVDGNGVVTDPDGTEPFTFNELEGIVDGKQGWYFDFDSDGTSPASRGISRATFWQDLVLFNSYNPPTATSCLAEGFSDIWAVYHSTGTAHPQEIGFNITDDNSVNDAGYPEKVPKIELGYGIASDITLYRTKDGTSKPIVQLTTGEIVDTEKVTGGAGKSGRQSWREIPLN